MDIEEIARTGATVGGEDAGSREASAGPNMRLYFFQKILRANTSPILQYFLFCVVWTSTIYYYNCLDKHSHVYYAHVCYD